MASGVDGDAATGLLQFRIGRELHWLYRSQPTHDHGIDAHVEATIAGVASGRILALQIKGGSSYFSRSVAGGWKHSVSARHATYWLRHSLPVVLVLVNLENRKCYWAEITAASLKSTGKNFSLFVPESHELSGALELWNDIVDGSLSRAREHLESNLDALPPSCTQPLRRIAVEHSDIAALLASTLAADFDDAPSLATVVLADHRGWLDAAGIDGWLTMANFALEHEVAAVAAIAFKAAAELDQSRAARLFALAALQSIDGDLNEARELIARAVVANPAEIAVVVTESLVDLKVSERPISQLSAEVVHRMQLAQDDTLALQILARRAAFQRNESEAIRLFEEVLRISPLASSIMIELAGTYNRRAASPMSTPGDLARSELLGDTALAQRRKWTTNTLEALLAKLRALNLQGRHLEVLTAATRAPLGTASDSESSNYRIAKLALSAATHLGQTGRLRSIVENIADVTRRKLLVRELFPAKKQTKRAQIKLGSELLEIELLDNDAETISQRVFSLALLGVDRSDAIAPIVEAGVLPAHYPELIEAIAKASLDPSSARASLSALSRVEPLAASALIEALRRESEFVAASQEAIRAFERFHTVDFLEDEIANLIRAGDSTAAEVRMREALAAGLLAGSKRTYFRTSLAEQDFERADWDDAAAQLAAVLREDPNAPQSTIWNLILCELQRQKPIVARSLIEQHFLDPKEPAEIDRWVTTYNLTGWTPKAATRAVSLAVEIAETNPKKASFLVSSIVSFTQGTNPADIELSDTVDARPLVPGVIHVKAFKLIDDLMAVHGDSLGFRRLDVESPSFISDLKELTGRSSDTHILDSLVRSIRRTHTPLGTLAWAIRRPYGLLLSQGGVGVTIASLADADAHQRETNSARSSLGASVVVDLSAVVLADGLGRFGELRNLFTDVILSRAQRGDSLAATQEALNLTASAGTMNWSEEEQRLIFSERSAADQVRVLASVQRLDQLCESMTTRAVNSPTEADTDQVSAKSMGEWVDSIILAKQLQLPLWSDDAAHRSLARELEVVAFGTVNIVEALTQAAYESPDQSECDQVAQDYLDFERQLIDKSVVDQEISLERLIQIIRDESGLPTGISAVLTRPAWWAEQGSIDPWLVVRGIVRELSPKSVAVWQARTMQGLALALIEQPEEAARILALIAVLGYQDAPDVTDARQGLAIAESIATSSALPNPRDFVVQATATLGSFSGDRARARFVTELLAAARA